MSVSDDSTMPEALAGTTAAQDDLNAPRRTRRILVDEDGNPIEELDEPSKKTAAIQAQYEIIDRIGDGGMGVVYLARDNRLGRHVAIKRLNKTSLENPSIRERFFQEAKAIATLNHIHIVHVYAMGEDEEGPYIVMEYIPGPDVSATSDMPPPPFTLDDRIQKSGAMSADEATAFMLKLCGAVEYAHSCGVIHRDLKPTNVLLNECGEPKIVDFGLARRNTAADVKLTIPGTRMLSMGYGAPEQESDASVADERADVYGIGGLTYFCLTGKNPRYYRENEVPEPLRQVVSKALETDVEKRWQSVAGFTEVLLQMRTPSTMELRTNRTIWRCKWCDASNPVLSRFCGKCGWDGEELCHECGAENRIGIPYCGTCGADARAYEGVVKLLERLGQLKARHDYTSIGELASEISGFQAKGENGREMLKRIRLMKQSAAQAIERLEVLDRSIPREYSGGQYEQAARHIVEYDSLSDKRPFEEMRNEIPGRIAERNLKEAGAACKDNQLAYAAKLCREIVETGSDQNGEGAKLLQRIRTRQINERTRRMVAAGLIAFLIYVGSAAPAYRLAGRPEAGWFHAIYRPVVLLQKSTVTGPVLERYAALWNSEDMTGPVPDPEI